jgi:hypothetical protein
MQEGMYHFTLAQHVLLNFNLLVFYNANIPTELADRLFMSGPLSINRHLLMHYLHKMARSDPDPFDAVEAAGFRTERFGDLFYTVFQRGGGHYMDTGASAKIAQGLVCLCIPFLALDTIPELSSSKANRLIPHRSRSTQPHSRNHTRPMVSSSRTDPF